MAPLPAPRSFAWRWNSLCFSMPRDAPWRRLYASHLHSPPWKWVAQQVQEYRPGPTWRHAGLFWDRAALSPKSCSPRFVAVNSLHLTSCSSCGALFALVVWNRTVGNEFPLAKCPWFAAGDFPFFGKLCLATSIGLAVGFCARRCYRMLKKWARVRRRMALSSQPLLVTKLPRSLLIAPCRCILLPAPSGLPRIDDLQG